MTTVYVTAPPPAASEITRTLLEERLTACVNRYECHSTFRWEGEILEEEEVALLIKTTPDRYEDLEARVEAIHPYDVPCIERFDEAGRFTPFAEWVDESVR